MRILILGGGAIGLDPALADRSDFVLLVQPCPEVAAEKLRDGRLSDLAPTLLQLMGLPQPAEMTGVSLIA